MVCILGDISIQILCLFFNWAAIEVLYIFWIQVFYGIYDLQREFRHFPSFFCYRFILPVVHSEQKTSGPQEATFIWLISSMVLISWTWQTRCTPRWAGEYGSWALTLRSYLTAGVDSFMGNSRHQEMKWLAQVHTGWYMIYSAFLSFFSTTKID